MGLPSKFQVGRVMVATSNNGPLTPEQCADAALYKIIRVGEGAHPLIRDQAMAYKEQIRKVIADTVRDAVLSDRKYRQGV